MFINRRTVTIEWGTATLRVSYFTRATLPISIPARVELFEAAGFPKKQMLLDFGLMGIPMVDTRARFLIPSGYGDRVIIDSAIERWGNSSFDVVHRLYRGDDLAVEGFETRVWAITDPENPNRIKGRKIPQDVKDRFETKH